MRDSYEGGYLKALLDVKDYFDYHSDGLKHWRAFNSKIIPKICQAFIDHRKIMMTYGGMKLPLALTEEKEIILDKSRVKKEQLK